MYRPLVFEPIPVLNCFQNKFVERKIILKRQGLSEPIDSILGKRTLEQAFGKGMNDAVRYGQEIPPDFFKQNYGHNIYPSSEFKTNIYNKYFYQEKMQYWREKYITKY